MIVRCPNCGVVKRIDSEAELCKECNQPIDARQRQPGQDGARSRVAITKGQLKLPEV
ncbi:MAG: hypothetical protein DVB33_02250 [Verrucomicrobia bacterium]|nr:MAG: hypothetical protein DVB33_02250 [Verrucomicrobiota bacterium]